MSLVFLYTEVYSSHCCCFMTCCRPKLYLLSRSCLAAAGNIHWLFLKTFCVLTEQSAKVYHKFISCEAHLLAKFCWRCLKYAPEAPSIFFFLFLSLHTILPCQFKVLQIFIEEAALYSCGQETGIRTVPQWKIRLQVKVCKNPWISS